MTESYQRTTTAMQGDTLDDVAHRFYAERANAVLPLVIELNSQYCPFAQLPLHAVIILPDDNVSAVAPSIKLWD